MPRGLVELSVERRFDLDHSAALLQDADEVVGRHDAGIAPLEFGRVHVVDCDVVLTGAGQDAFDQTCAFDSEGQGAGLAEKWLADQVGEFVPELVGAPHEGHVGRTLVVGLADPPRIAVGRAHHVGRMEAVEANHALSAPGQMPGGSRPHRTKSNNGHVISLGHARSSSAAPP